MNISNTLSSQKIELITLAEKVNQLPKKLAFALVIVTFLLSLVGSLSAQIRSGRWIYTSTSRENIKQYYRSNIRKVSLNRRRGWVKMIFPDASFVIASHIWDCKRSLSKTTSITMYNKRGVVIGKSKGSGWQEVIPESINEKYLLRVCGFQKDNTWIQVITENANLRSSNSRYSPVLRIAQKRQRFRVIEYRKDDIWFNIVDEKTQQDYWIHQTTIRIIKPRNRKRRRK